MEAVGAAAAIAQLVGLSLTAGKIIRRAVSSFRHAPAEIMELDRKLQSFHTLVMQVASLWDELPETQTSAPLLSDHQIGMFSMSMQNISNALNRIKSINEASTEAPYDVCDRLRWAVLDKKKAQSLLRNAQAADCELGVILQVLNARISSMTRSSLLALSIGQAETRQILEDIRAVVMNDGLQLKGPNSTIIALNNSANVGIHQMQSGYRNDPRHRLIEHNMQPTRTYPVASFGHGGRPITSIDKFCNMGVDITFESKRKSQKARALFNASFRILGQKLIRLQIQAQLLCRSWTLTPSITSSVTIINLRPSKSPIFLACQRWDFEEVHYLLNAGEASINDADEEVGGLLDHVVSGKWMTTYERFGAEDKPSETDFVQGAQPLFNYLISQGCDPSIIHGSSRNPLPAILRAFQRGYTEATSLMLSNGADLLSFGNTLGGLFDASYLSMSQFLWQVGLARSVGYSDWRFGDSTSNVAWGDSDYGASWNNLNNLLYGATWVKQADLVLFALEIAGIDPNQGGRLDSKPISIAAHNEWVAGITMLLQYGARVNVNNWDWSGTPLHRSIRQPSILTDASHYLLLQGADPRLRNFRGLSVLSHIITQQYSPEIFSYLGFSYITLEGSFAHLFHHDSDPFEILATDYRKRAKYAYPLRVTWIDLLGPFHASDIARFWSYGIRRKLVGFDQFRTALPEGISELMKLMDDSRDFDWRFQWNSCGIMDRVLNGPLEEGQSTFATATPVCDETHQQCFDANAKINLWDSVDDPDAKITEQGAFVPLWEHIDMADPNWLDMGDLTGVSPGFFRNATAFHRHTASVNGRTQLSRWPLVRALCDGLQHAGYRVEMDDDGDLWYDCDDADRYFDAWETQPAEDREDWLVDVCPICQNFEEYGLGHILEIEKDTKDKIREYQRQAKEGKRRFF